MEAKKHPEYAVEQGNLTGTISWIDEKLRSCSPPREVYAADQRAAQAARKEELELVKRLKEQRKLPYFGRVDWDSDDEPKPETFYIGSHAIPEMRVYSWKETMPGRLYYEGRCDEDGQLLLQRAFLVDADNIYLTDINDEYVASDRATLMNLLTVVADTSTQEGGDALLIQLLAQNREGKLHEIVVSIQEEQFHLIRSPVEKTLLIQGVPGSGKTAIALHRLAYLVYRRKDDKAFVNRERTVFLGPNPIFMNYVAQVLPTLGEQNVSQKTFDKWIQERLGDQLSTETEETALETLIDPQIPLAVRVMRYRNARNKGSMRMAELLKRYTQHLITQSLTDLGDLKIEVNPGRKSSGVVRHMVRNQEIQALFAKTWNIKDYALSVEETKKRFEAQLKQTVWRQISELVAGQASSFSDKDTSQRRSKEQSDKQIESCLSPWTAFNVSVAYRGLFRSGDLLQRLGEGIFNTWDLELMHLDAPKQGTPFRFGDLGALLYLHQLLNGIDSSELLDHLVIDEAQDVTPILFAVFRNYCRTQSMTIIGDLSQGIYADHGLHSWEELTTLLGEDQLSLHTVRQSYRSTEPIIQYANQLLRRCGVAEEFLAQPLARSGPAPHTGYFKDQSDRAEKLIKLIKNEQAEGHQSVAILTKTLTLARELSLDLEEAGDVDDVQLIEHRDVMYEGGVVIMPVYLAKGLEFDTVIIPDADAETYAPVLLDMRLLYVAITRASHSLHIGRIGAQTPLLNPTVDQIKLEDFYEDRLSPQLETIETFAQQSASQQSVDFYVERLASEGKLDLLKEGLFDSTALGVLAAEWSRRSGDAETVAAPLDFQMQNAIRSQVRDLLDAASPDTQQAVALMQLTYGLLRNVLASVDIRLAEDVGTDPQEQAVALSTFLNALRTSNLSFSLGARTTERRVLQAVAENQSGAALPYLQRLIEHGMVERHSQAQGDRIRVSYDWVESLVLAALGHHATQWDSELWADWPRLPRPISQQVLESDTVAMPSGATETQGVAV